mgnify:CR=1 FL=1|tara:strand:+ start:130 stop:315 length:186 start_codon:yes stop_codon:yes gene_type:complete
MATGCATVPAPKLYEMGGGEVIKCGTATRTVCGMDLSDCDDGSEIFCAHDLRAVEADYEFE